MRSPRSFALPCFLAVSILATAATAAAQGSSTGAVRGVVRDTAGEPIALAEVSWLSGRMLSDSAGRFRAAGLQPGLVAVEVRRLGYRAVIWRGQVAAGEVVPLELTLVPVPLDLEPVVVAGTPNSDSQQLRGFYLRRQRHQGYFLTRDQIEPYDHARLTDVLRARVPAVGLSGAGLGPARLRLRGQRCAPMVWIDGGPTPAAEFDLDAIPPSTVEAIEVYPGAASAPVEFRTAYGRDSCGGIIVLWSRMGGREDDLEPEIVAALSKGPPLPVYHADEVDEPAAIDTMEFVQPHYPDSLRAFQVAGSVVALLVVDTTGVPVAGSIEVVSATSPAFGAAVVRALAVSRFVPARRAGRAVRQVLVVPFTFRTTPRR